MRIERSHDVIRAHHGSHLGGGSRLAGEVDADALRRHIAGRLALRRMELNLTQHDFCVLMPCRESDVEQWESGERRIDAMTLWTIADRLNTNVAYFFADAEDSPSERQSPEDTPGSVPAGTGTPADSERVTLMTLFENIRSDRDRKTLVQLVGIFASRSL
jgi:transcriptional regulator with XRE-family HTH domain